MKNENLPGPSFFRNWKKFTQAKKTGDKPLFGYECPSYSDVHVIGENANDLEPYEILNCCTAYREPVCSTPAMILRAWGYDLENDDSTSWGKTNIGGYHGGDESDEIAALLSLELGCRIKAGNQSREFTHDNLLGRPTHYQFKDEPILLNSHRRLPMLPWTGGNRNIERLPLFGIVCKFDEKKLITVVRCARMYQEAVWIADFDPQQAWLLLVSAIETAAAIWCETNDSSLEKLKWLRPDLGELLLKAGEPLASIIADMLIETMGSTKKFVEFLLRYLPEPPDQRPERSQIEWNASYFEKAFRTVYTWRSKFLHAGTPFPTPLLMVMGHDQGCYWERPVGLTVKAYGGHWEKKDLPFHLHIFEYIARNSLLRWIRESGET